MGAGDILEPKFKKVIPPGDDRERAVCERCGFTDYENPKIVAGSVVVHEDRFLLCKRAIEPRKGFWTLPAGFLEAHERPSEGAAREAWEEARARIVIDQLLALYVIPRISQVQFMFRATLESEMIEPGPESEEVGLYRWEDIPWADIAFPSVRWALEHWRESRDRQGFAPFQAPADGLGGALI